jgi:lysophospholipase L1-like esterase
MMLTATAVVLTTAAAAAALASPALPADPCAAGIAVTCGTTPSLCAEACAWNASHCVQHDGYPLPANDSLVALGALNSPLIQENLNIFFYGDSITWLGKYEPLIQNAIQTGAATSKLANISIVNQGENGGTVLDLVSGISPWGRLDFKWPIHPLNFTGSLNGQSMFGRPDIAGIMIGINDNLQGQVHPDPGVNKGRGSNVSEFTRVHTPGKDFTRILQLPLFFSQAPDLYIDFWVYL